jgi:DNA methylase
MQKSETTAPLRNPKRDKSSESGRASWYPYYAGYSPAFVEDAIAYGRARGLGQRVLDPWNGSGTTTQIAVEHGLAASGFDLNPAMIVVGRAKILDVNVLPSINSLLDDICSKANDFSGALSDDPLNFWLGPKSTIAFRSIDYAISTLLVDSKEYVTIAKLPSIDSVSALACFFYVALFRSLRTYLRSFEVSNPTWIKQASPDRSRVSVPLEKLLRTFRNQVRAMHDAVREPVPTMVRAQSVTATIGVAHSTQLPTDDTSCDLVISSPPYCTRIDYAIKTKPDLALLGYGAEEIRSLRDKMLGTPTVPDVYRASNGEWGSYCEMVLDRIMTHKSKASLSYYWKTYAQYFEGLFKSIQELSRVLMPSGLCFLVVQDSYYKDVHVDLAQIADDMARSSQFSIEGRFNFPSTRTMAGLNSVSRTYQAGHSHVESILVWKKCHTGTLA